MSTKHTPGPWVAICGEVSRHRSGNLLQSCTVYTEKTRAQLIEEGHTHYDKKMADVANVNVCSIGTYQKDIIGDEAIANSRLIAAAPDMLKVLQSLQPYAQKYLSVKMNDPAVAMWADEHTEQLFTDLINALARATGEKEVQP